MNYRPVRMSGSRMENCEGRFMQSLGSQGQALGLYWRLRGPLGGLDPEGAGSHCSVC